jgi:hypothetical protein
MHMMSDMNFLSWLLVEKTFEFMWFKTDVKLITKSCFVGYYYCHSVFIEILLIPFYVKNLANYGSFHTNFTCASYLNWYEKFLKKVFNTITCAVWQRKKTDWYQDQYGMFKSWYKFPTLSWTPNACQAFILVEKPKI